jgi:transcriptional regulator with XRE-family HTH domain
MADATYYHFDSLPLHPHPEHLESFTSYLTRLAEVNGLRFMEGLAAICFFDQYVRSIKSLKDNPPLSFGTLPIASSCPNSTLLATTFFHLVRKFGRPGLPQSASHFLSGVTARTLRYCPGCIAESPYHRLTWRFRYLPGCPRHNNVLLDKCSHCGHSIPIFRSPFHIGICGNCRGDLRTCPAAILTTEERNTAVAYAQELEFLLLPQPWEAYANASRIGAYFAELRQKRRLTIVEVAQLIGTTRQGVEAAEYGNINTNSSPFERYIRYARFLDLSVQELFEETMLCNSRPKGPRARNLPLSEEEMVERLQQAIGRLNDRGVLVTQRSLSKEIGVARNRFGVYPRVKNLLKETLSNVRAHQEKHRELRQEEIYERVRVAINHLEALGIPVTRRALADLVGVSAPVFRYYPKVKALVDQHTGRQEAAGELPSTREDELVAQVEHAITQLQSLGQPFTQGAISEMVGVRVSVLLNYPRVNALLKQVTSIYHQDRKRAEQALLSEEVVAANVEKAVRQLECLGKLVTQRAVSTMMGVPASSLYYYPKVISLIQSVIKDKRLQSIAVQTQLREEEWAMKVTRAIEDLRRSRRSVSVSAIVKEVQLSEGALKRYPRVKEILDQVVLERRDRRKRST